MTYLLASVRDAHEAAMALQADADVIDLKDPQHGALGALPLSVVREAVAAVGRRRPVSATLGDAPMPPGLWVERAAALAECGVDYVKVGLPAGPAADACIDALSGLAAQVALVGVLFADERPDLRVLRRLAGAGFSVVMLDTANKAGGGLRRHITDAGLGRFVGYAATHGLCSGLAGSLGLGDIAPLLALGPEYLGFRGALCAGGERGAGLDADAMARVRLAIPRHSDAAGSGVRAVSENGRESPRPAFGAGDPARPC